VVRIRLTCLTLHPTDVTSVSSGDRIMSDEGVNSGALQQMARRTSSSSVSSSSAPPPPPPSMSQQNQNQIVHRGRDKSSRCTVVAPLASAGVMDDDFPLDPSTRLIALRLHQLEMGQKKILQALSMVLESSASHQHGRPQLTNGYANSSPKRSSATANGYHHSNGISVVEEGLPSSCGQGVEEGERIVRIRLKASNIKDSVLASNSGCTSTGSIKANGSIKSKPSSTSGGPVQKSVAFRLDKECQTSSVESTPTTTKRPRTPAASETSTDDDYSQCSCRKSCDCQEDEEDADNVDQAINSVKILNESIRINRELMEQIDLSAAQIKSRDQEIERLKGELREATESLEVTMAEEQASGKACQAPVIDLGTESPLNLFIQCFKEKYDICVNPNDVAIFV